MNEALAFFEIILEVFKTKNKDGRPKYTTKY